MKKPTAIFFLLLFAFSQYARTFSYLECKFFNSFRSASAKCDCEKQAGLDKPGNGSSQPKDHRHIHLDEYFSFSKVALLSATFFLRPGISYSTEEDDECEGVRSLPLLPPDC